MIQFTGNKNLKKEVESKPKRAEKPWAFGMICKSGLMLAMIFSACGMRVYFSDKTEKLNRHAREIKAETRRMDLEIQNLIVKREHMYSHKYIQSKIAQYKLALRPTAGEQIRYLKYYQVSPGADEAKVQVASMPVADQAPLRTASIK